jgi:hypothetical protein
MSAHPRSASDDAKRRRLKEFLEAFLMMMTHNGFEGELPVRLWDKKGTDASYLKIIYRVKSTGN